VAGEEQRGSVAIVNWELAKCLAQRHQVIFYAPRVPGQPLTQSWGSIEIRRIRYAARPLHKAIQLVAGRLGGRVPYAFSPLYYLEYYWQIAHELHTDPADVVHIPVQLQMAGLFRRAAPNARIVSHMHQDEMAQLDDAYLRSHMRDVDSVVTVSDFITSRARARFPEFADRIHTIGNGVDTDRFRPNGAVAGERPARLLFVGRVAPDKGVHLLMEAFNAVAPEFPGLELEIVGKPGMMPFDVLSVLLRGDPALESLRTFYGRSFMGWLSKEVFGQRHSYVDHLRGQLTAESSRRVHFRGTVSLEELVSLYQHSDLLVLPSVWQESYGLPVAEAMASGVAVLASHCGGVPELVDDGASGRLVPRLDVEALTRVLRELLTDVTRLRELGRAGRQRAERLLTWDRSARRLEQVYLGGVPEV
jgi:glycosyltransferase involved in cell wall biosynthesis